MEIYPLHSQQIDHSELIDAVIRFANADLNNPADVLHYFNGTWKPTSIPQLRACRGIQADVRTQLLNFAHGFHDRDCEDAMRGLEWRLNERKFEHLDTGIRLEGWPAIEKVPVMGGYKEQLVWKLHVKSAPLRAVCGLAGRIILLEGLDRAVGECARDGCDNIFLDRDSRGKRRIYCRDAKCQAALNAAGARANRDFKKLPPKVQADYKRLKREDPSLTQEKYVSQYSQSIKTGTKVKIADTKRTRK